MGEFAFEALYSSKTALVTLRLLFVFGYFLHNYSAKYEYTNRPTIRIE